MTDIIDKVAEAISDKMLEVEGEFIHDPKSLATAALEALAEGLVWDDREGLTLRGACVGYIYNDEGPFVFNFCDIDVEDFETEEEAKIAAMNHARRVLFGLGPVGEGNG